MNSSESDPHCPYRIACGGERESLPRILTVCRDWGVTQTMTKQPSEWGPWCILILFNGRINWFCGGECILRRA
jgi:hypothetical protein